MTNHDNIYQPPSASSGPPQVAAADISAPQKDVRLAAIAAFISAGFTSLLIIAAMNGVETSLARFDDPAYFFDVLLIALCGIGMLRFSRIAAVFVFVYFLLSKIVISIEMGRPTGIGLGLVFLYFYWRGIRGSFAYHRLQREANPDYRSSSPLAYIIGIPVIALLVLTLGLGVLTQTSLLPSTEVIEGNQLTSRDLDLLRSEHIIEEDETVRLFYSTGLLSIRDEGNLLTDRRVVSYERVEDEMWVYSALFGEIARAHLVQKGDFLNDSVLDIATTDGHGFLLVLSAENGGDDRFLRALTADMESARR
jgi:hypothetical protein